MTGPRRTPGGDVILPGLDDSGVAGRGLRGGADATTTPAPGSSRRGAGSRPDRRTIRLRVAAAVLGVLALAAGVVTAVAVSAARPSPGVPLLPAAVSPAPTSGTEYRTRPIRPYPDLPGRTAGTSRPGTPRAPGAPGGSAGTGGTGAPRGTVTADPPAPSTTAPSSPPTSEPPPADSAGGVKAARARVTDFVAALNDNDPDRANGFLCADLAGSFGAGMLDGIRPGSLGVGGVSVRGATGTAYVSYLPAGGGQPARALFGLVVEHHQWMICTPPS